MSVPQRRIDDRIRAACSNAIAASSEDLGKILQELLGLVHEKSERIKARAVRLFMKGEKLEREHRDPFRL